MEAESSDTLHRAVQGAIAGSVGSRRWTWPDEDFEALAQRLFAYQFAQIPAYAQLSRNRGVHPKDRPPWHRIPAVPTELFKRTSLFCGDPSRDAQITFRTSGTTEGRRGEHHLRHDRTYQQSLGPWLSAFLLRPGPAPQIYVLAPSQGQAEDSSLSHMLQWAVDCRGASGSAFFWGDAGPELAAAHRAMLEACRQGQTTLVLGTARAVQALLDWIEELPDERRLSLPEGSGLMETGGFKGATASIPPAEFRLRLSQSLGLPTASIVSEYGMTELGSQGYQASYACRWDQELRKSMARLRSEWPQMPGLFDAGDQPRHFVFPPWCRVRAVDSGTLAPLPFGEEGLLCFWDLSNIDSIIAIQTADRGVVLPEGLVLYGRAKGSPPRGCSLAVAEVLGDALSGGPAGLDPASLPKHGIDGGAGEVADEVAASLARLRRAGDSLAALSLDKRIDGLVRFAEVWLAPDSEPRDRALRELPEECGFSAAALGWGLDQAFSSLTEDSLLRWWKAEGRSPLGSMAPVGHIWASNVVTAGLPPLVAALLAGRPSLVKAPSAAPGFGRLVQATLEEAAPELGAACEVLAFGRDDFAATAALLSGCERSFAFGEDRSLDEIAACAPEAKLLRFGSRYSCSIVAGEWEPDDQGLDALLLDRLAWDGGGCLSPKWVFVEGTPNRALELAKWAADRAPLVAGKLPGLPLPLGAGAARLAWLAEHSIDGWTAAGIDWAVAAVPHTKLFELPGRSLAFVPVPRLEELERILDVLGPRLQGLSWLGDRARCEAIAAHLAPLGLSRMVAAGLLQSPPMDWNHDDVCILAACC